MKRTVLLMLVLAFAMAGSSQNLNLKSGIKFDKAPGLHQTQPKENSQTSEIKIPGEFKSTDVVSIITLGSAPNAYGFGSGNKGSCLHYNAELNTVVFIHQRGGELDPGANPNFIGYDISTDGGQNWSLINPLLSIEDLPARYPQAAIYNPDGNLNPDEAYVGFVASTLDGSNNGWGGIVFGRGKIGDISDTTYNILTSDTALGIYHTSTSAFTLDNNGTMWIMELNQDWSTGQLEWLEQIIVNKFVWNESELDFELDEQFLIGCPTEERPVDIKVEFSPDGNFGYMAVLGNLQNSPGVDSESYYPIIWHTEDAGETWDGPIKVALAGEDGIWGVQNYLSDEELAELYDPVPPRDEIPFTTAFDFDLTVDCWGNPHIAVIVGITGGDPFSIITDISPSSGYMYTAAMLLSSQNAVNSGDWLGAFMGRQVSFRGSFGYPNPALTEDNRIQITRNPVGDRLFVSWIDTDSTVSSENNAPDIWCRGVDLVMDKKTMNSLGEDRAVNVTFGSEGTFSSYFFSASNISIEPGTGDYVVPFVFMNMSPTDPAQPVLFKYIQDFQFTDADFMLPLYGPVGLEENQIFSASKINVLGPFPNPANGIVEMHVRLHQPASASLTLTNLMGQTVKQLEERSLSSGTNKFSLDVSDLKPGIYFITIEANGKKVSRKLVVE